MTDLGITLDRDADVPLGVQLAWSLRARILSGELAPRQRLPGLREFAGGLGVNLNTVRTVYDRLERTGLVTTLQGSGTYVADPAAERTGLADVVDASLRAAEARGVDVRDVAAALYVADARPATPGVAAAERRGLRAEIAVLERALAAVQARHPELTTTADGAPSTRPQPAGRLLSVAELEAVRDGVLSDLVTAHARQDGTTAP